MFRKIMMCAKRWLLMLFCCAYFANYLCGAKDFGPAIIRIKKLVPCKGPKRTDCATAQYILETYTKVRMEITVLEDVTLIYGKSSGMLQGVEVVKMQARPMCDNFMFYSIFKVALNLTDNCTIFKGNFDLLIKTFQVCNGPKRKNCANANSTIVHEAFLDYYLDVNESIKPNKGKILVLNPSGRETFRLQVKNPCEHLFLKPLFLGMFNVTNDCLIPKGQYHFQIDIQEIARKYYGGEFIYGSWTFKSMFHNDHCNLSCSVIGVQIAPQNKNKETG